MQIIGNEAQDICKSILILFMTGQVACHFCTAESGQKMVKSKNLFVSVIVNPERHRYTNFWAFFFVIGIASILKKDVPCHMPTYRVKKRS